ncbi:LeoA/HP0731 family dynamin-like GTPase [Anaerovibrio sp. RM50]|uniref:LeoA/HP0731 family dynamin-like GTPase n=1 Tax=Anaerovibrio sp. RM50 TaxID=1200557 RepID=UPI00055E7E40|nr:LeoA/HP0731 family dynamin-like GTPase [Anaerovibrio sp. RM50]
MNKNATVEKFKEQNRKIALLLDKLKEFVVKGEKLGVIVDRSIDNKLERITNLIGGEARLKIALIGGFSEGKTSIAAAWMERLDKNTMKISQQESSDEVNVYIVDEDIELIDTPGLFGFKEKINDAGAVEKYREITKKYVSEAHLVLYVMDSANPIKESHREELVWLFRELNLLPRTVFVLSRFDEVSDIEDDWDYHENLNIKKSNVIGRLKNVLNLSNQEEEELQIVGVAANPFGMGTSYWLQNMDQFKKISKIETLQEATRKTISHNGGYVPLVYEMQHSVIQDVLLRQMPEVKAQKQEIDKAVDALEENCDSLEKNINGIEKNIPIVQQNLLKSINSYFDDLIVQARGCGINTVQAFLDAEIGKEGCIMYSHLQNEIARKTKSIEADIDKTTLEFNANLNQFDSAVAGLSKKGLSYLTSNSKTLFNSQNVLAVRDGVVGLGKMMGADLSKVLKFKPWGATKLANSLGNVVAFVGMFMEIWGEYKEKKAEEEFHAAMNKFIEDMGKIQKEIIEMINSSDFAEKFFPAYVSLKENLDLEKKNIRDYKDKQSQFNNWCQEGVVIEAEFTELSSHI